MIRALASGFVGACALTATHQLVKHSRPDAPRLDKLGMQSLQKVLNAVGISPDREKLFEQSMIGDLLLNTIYFAQVGDKRGFGALIKGVSLGCAMGASAVAVPDAIGVDGNTTHKTPTTAAMTIALYGLGGLAAALAAQVIGKSK